MAVTIKDVAAAAGVSTATVSHVFNATRFVAPETAERVREAAKQLGYIPSINASSLRSNRSKRIGLLVPSIASFFSVDILDAVAKDQGFQYEVQVLGWDASIAACQAGQADGMIAGASITDERKESGWIFSDGYYDANQSMAVAAGSDIKGFEDLNGKSVAVKTASMSATYAESLADKYGFTVTYFEDSPTMYQAVVGGQVAACFDDTPIMASNLKDTGIGMEIVDGTGNDPAAYGFAIFNKDNQELIDMFNAGLANIKADGTYDEIIAKYLG